MVQLTDLFEKNDVFDVASHELVWSIEEAPELFEALGKADPAAIRAFGHLKTKLPYQRAWAFGEWGPFSRPDRHVRALYLQLDRLDGQDKGKGSIAIKGSEALATNFGSMIDRLTKLWNVYSWSLGGLAENIFVDYGMLSALERFPVLEGKPPGVHPVWDAHEESECAVEFQRAHLARYGELAHIPVPLGIIRWPDEVGERILGELADVIRPKVRRIVETEIRDGLGTFIYYYPTLPLRVMHVQTPDVGRGATYEGRQAALARTMEPKVCVERWLDICSRMLCMGYVGTDPANLNRGYCVMAQNLCTDGGFVDVNSLRHIDSFQQPEEARFAITRTIQVLSQSITWFMVGTDAGKDLYTIHAPEIFAAVYDGLKARIRSEVANGRVVPASVKALTEPESAFAALNACFSSICALQAYHPTAPEEKDYRG